MGVAPANGPNIQLVAQVLYQFTVLGASDVIQACTNNRCSASDKKMNHQHGKRICPNHISTNHGLGNTRGVCHMWQWQPWRRNIMGITSKTTCWVIKFFGHLLVRCVFLCRAILGGQILVGCGSTLRTPSLLYRPSSPSFSPILVPKTTT